MLAFFVSVALSAVALPSDADCAIFYNGKCETIVQTGSVHRGISPDECGDMAALDKRLNATYRRRMASLDQDAKTALKTSQRQWIANRNAACGLDEPVSIADEWAASCFMNETNKRLSFLENRSTNMCGPWVGEYSGKLLADQNFFGQAEQVSVIVESDAITVQIWGDDGGGFLGSAIEFKCASNSLRSTLDTGAGGEGKISLFMSRDKETHLRLYGYKQGIGPNKAGYLPPDQLKIPLRKVP